jgi:hypothetical protein
MKVFVVNRVRRGQLCLEHATADCLEILIVLFVVQTEIIEAHLKGTTQLDCDFLLLLKDELVVLHVFLGVGLQIGTNLMQIQAIFVRTFLSIHEKLAKLGRAK